MGNRAGWVDHRDLVGRWEGLAARDRSNRRGHRILG
jgi:hypothetical protein